MKIAEFITMIVFGIILIAYIFYQYGNHFK